MCERKECCRKRPQIFGVDLAMTKEIRDKITDEEWQLAIDAYEALKELKGPGYRKSLELKNTRPKF